ncbi:MAG: serine/threonine protein kinase, partial [Kofleriaceae bacterium]
MDALYEAADDSASSENRYAILARLATGGMAELFLARTASAAGVERYVVLKRVLAHRLGDTHFVAMFLDEARLAAQLQHPNIAQVFDAGKLGDSFFFSMEYVHGVTVRELQHRSKELGQPIPIGSTSTIAASAAAGLHHAHERIGFDG